MVCKHEIWEQDTASHADGLCPLCLHAEIERLRAALAAAVLTMEEVSQGKITRDGPTIVSAISAARSIVEQIGNK